MNFVDILISENLKRQLQASGSLVKLIYQTANISDTNDNKLVCYWAKMNISSNSHSVGSHQCERKPQKQT